MSLGLDELIFRRQNIVSCDRRSLLQNISISQIPQSICSISHNAPFETEMCTFLFINGALCDMEEVPCWICELGQFPDRAVVTHLTHPWQPHFPVTVRGRNLVPSDINVLIHDPVPSRNLTNQELFSSNGYNVNFRQSPTTKNGYQIFKFKVPRDFGRSRQPYWITSFDQQNIF